jgi:hypothetical protein
MVSYFFAGGQGSVASFEKGLVEPRKVRIVNSGILHTVNRGWRDANRTAAGTAALQRTLLLYPMTMLISAKSSTAQTTLVPLSSIFERTINTLAAGGL